MGISRIEQLIEDIYEFVESCRMQPLSTTKVIVPKDELYDLLDELRLRTPDEIKRYQKIIANRDAILADAEEKAKAIMADADGRAQSLINNHEIMQQAYDQANEMVSIATADAERILASANSDANQIRAYTEELLTNFEKLISGTYNNTKKNYETLINSLQNTLEVIESNKKELIIPEEEPVKEEEPASDENNDSDDDFDFDENAFLDDLD
jgi:cell division septum initiation protein DivIVA